MPDIQKPTKSLIDVLAVLLSAYESRELLHGIDVARRARTVPAATYPLLDWLQEVDLVTADWEPPSRPARVRRPLYQLTIAGVLIARGFQSEGHARRPQERREGKAEPGDSSTP